MRSPLEHLAPRIVRHILDACDPYAIAHASLQNHGPSPASITAVGKAAIPMLRAALDVYPNVHNALAVSPTHLNAHDPLHNHATIHTAHHPIPSRQSCAAHTHIVHNLHAAHTCSPPSTHLVLLSGGTSALWEHLPDDITLQDLQEATHALQTSGADIEALNTVRKHLSLSKGGQTPLSLQHTQPIHVLALSDVVSDRFDLIGSGPFAHDPSTFEDAFQTLRPLLPPTHPTLLRLQKGSQHLISETPKPHDPRLDHIQHTLLANRTHAAHAAVEVLRTLGFQTHLRNTSITGEAHTVGTNIAHQALQALHNGDIQPAQPTAWVFTGETTTTLTPQTPHTARGGPCQELALASLLALQHDRMYSAPIAFISFSTDGIDGPTQHAGAWVDATTIYAADALQRDPNVYLQDHNSATFFNTLPEHITTGPTGSNLNDVLIVLFGPSFALS